MLGRGGGGTVYHNKYAVVNDKGRVLASTSKAAQFVRPATRGSGPPPPRAVASREARLNEQLDSLTRALVAHLEAHGHVRVLGLAATYSLDAATGQPVLLWASDIMVCMCVFAWSGWCVCVCVCVCVFCCVRVRFFVGGGGGLLRVTLNASATGRPRRGSTGPEKSGHPARRRQVRGGGSRAGVRHVSAPPSPSIPPRPAGMLTSCSSAGARWANWRPSSG